MDRINRSGDDEGFIQITPERFINVTATKVADAQREIVAWINSLSDFDLEGSAPGSPAPRSMSDVIKGIKEDHGVDVVLKPVFDENGNVKVTFEMLISKELYAEEVNTAA